MKKIIITLMSILLVFNLCGCRIYKYSPKEYSLLAEKKIIEQTDLHQKYHLTGEDYMLYSDGHLIDDMREHVKIEYSFIELTQNELKGKTLETKRNIRIGSPAEDISVAYKNVPGFITFESNLAFHTIPIDALQEDTENIISEVQDTARENEVFLNEYFLRYDTYYLNKQYIGYKAFHDYLTQNGYKRDKETGNYTSKPPETEVSILLFHVKNNIVNNIHIIKYWN